MNENELIECVEVLNRISVHLEELNILLEQAIDRLNQVYEQCEEMNDD